MEIWKGRHCQSVEPCMAGGSAQSPIPLIMKKSVRYALWLMATHKIQPGEISTGGDSDGVLHKTRRRLFRNSNGNLYAPYFNRDDSNREFNLNDVHDKWNDDNVLVAFRATSSQEFPIRLIGRVGFVLECLPPRTHVFSNGMYK
jgi:hypothetical protein